MYCKNCGKQIADDSKFCKYCGALVEDSITTKNHSDEIKEDSKIVVSTKEESPVKIEIKKKSIVKESTAANEIVANFKMLGIAFILWLVYILGFSVVHQKDIKQMDENSYYGESCYDPSNLMLNHDITDWQIQYALKVLTEPDYSKLKHPLRNKLDYMEFAVRNFNPTNDAEYNSVASMSKEKAQNYADNMARNKKLSKERQEALKNEAIQEAQIGKEELWNTLNDYRQSGYEDDLKKNTVWAAIIAFSLTILGRYFIKFGAWVIKNRT